MLNARHARISMTRAIKTRRAYYVLIESRHMGEQTADVVGNRREEEDFSKNRLGSRGLHNSVSNDLHGANTRMEVSQHS